MDESDIIEKLIEDISFRKSNYKDYEKMNVEQIGEELRDVMRFEQESFKKIEEFEKTQSNPDLASYAKMICRNTAEREIADIQQVYLKKIDTKYLNSR